MNDLLVSYTLFHDLYPKDAVDKTDIEWPALVERVKNAPEYRHKKECPLISMAEYGDKRSVNGYIRHSDNVRRIFGVEIDYDGEKVSLAQGAAWLQEQRIQGVLYTSASHTSAAPRWRGLFPLSEPEIPEKRAQYVGRINRILHGIGSTESFALSQSYFIGRVTGREYEVIETTGRCIDMASEIDALYPASHDEFNRDTRSNDDLRKAFENGEDRYVAMMKLSSRWAARGLEYDDICAALEELLSTGDSKNGDGIDLRRRIHPLAESAVRKFGGKHKLNGHAAAPDAQDTQDQSAPSDSKPAEEAMPTIFAKPFVWRDPKTIQPRPWLFGKHYMRGMASATAGIGGAGKSTMLLTEAIGAAIGRNLLTNESLPVGALNVWVHNGEDPFEELERRVLAIMQHFKIQPEEWEGRLHVTSGRDMPILVAEALSDGGKVFVPREDGVLLRDALIAKKIDIFIADPFITIHRVNENDNGLIDAVMTVLRNIAHQAQCSLEVAHHLRKLNGGDVSIDDIRGAGSIVGACRSVRLMAAMTQEEAQRYGIEDKDRRSFSWIVNGKANMLPPGHAREWVRAVGVDLGNASGVYEADNIGALERWLPPESFLDLTANEYHLVRRSLQEGRREDLRYDSRAKGWAGKIIATVLGKDIAEKSVRAEMLGLIERWKKAGKLKVEEFHDGRSGRALAVVRWADSSPEAE